MFEYIYEWLKNISAYLLLVAMVTGILPNEEYKKYIRFFCGLVLIVMLMMPLLRVANIDREFEEIFHSIEYKSFIKELEEAEKTAVEEISGLEE